MPAQSLKSIQSMPRSANYDEEDHHSQRLIRGWFDSFRRDPNRRITPASVIQGVAVSPKASSMMQSSGTVERLPSSSWDKQHGSHYYDLHAANLNTANTMLSRELKGRHLQMIAIGGSIGMYIHFEMTLTFVYSCVGLSILGKKGVRCCLVTKPPIIVQCLTQPLTHHVNISPPKKRYWIICCIWIITYRWRTSVSLTCVRLHRRHVILHHSSTRRARRGLPSCGLLFGLFNTIPGSRLGFRHGLEVSFVHSPLIIFPFYKPPIVFTKTN